jgi:endoglucanase
MTAMPPLARPALLALLGACAALAAWRTAPAGAAVEARAGAQQDAGAARIRLNQLGFHPAAPKTAIVVDGAATTFAVIGAERGDTVLRGTLGPARRWAPSGETVRRADLSRLTRVGRYVLVVPGVGRSHPFAVGADVVRPVAQASLKAFYFQRTAVPLPARYAGPWARAAGHPDTLVLVHASAADAGRPAGTRLSSPLGWYDAGDYNKYVVNSGITTSTLLSIAEHFPAYAAALAPGIPEAGGALPDVLDEALFNLRWMRTMQDPRDGGVYHKLTNAEFDGFVMPEHASATPRYVVQKSTAAALNLAAVAAQAARVLRAHPGAPPGLADSLVREATAAWHWARAHPDSTYDQERLNARFAPKINTGAYDDRTLVDEVRWAAAELFLATRRPAYLEAAEPLAAPAPDVPGWNSVRTLGLYALLEHRRALPAGFDTVALKRRLLDWTRTLVDRTRASAYGVPMEVRDFVWGSSAVAANQGIALVQAYRLGGDTAALHAAVATLDYLLGRNATGYSFVTGFGARTPLWPHHRPSAADTVAAPVPGMLVGGPNPGQQDACAGYPSKLPARSYVDSTCSYAANEIAINWNAPLAYLAAALDAIYGTRAR